MLPIGVRPIIFEGVLTGMGVLSPLFTTKMYQSLGIHWASSVPAFLALACLPFPFLFHHYGAAIRKRCFYSARAMRIMEQVQAKAAATVTANVSAEKPT